MERLTYSHAHNHSRCFPLAMGRGRTLQPCVHCVRLITETATATDDEYVLREKLLTIIRAFKENNRIHFFLGPKLSKLYRKICTFSSYKFYDYCIFFGNFSQCPSCYRTRWLSPQTVPVNDSS